MWRKLFQRLTDPVFYRKHGRHLTRAILRPSPEARKTSVDQLVETLGSDASVAVCIAHPDDEIFCAGLICELIDRGLSVNLICLTRGEGGPTGSKTRSSLGTSREEELRKSASALGIHSVHFLGYVDPVAKAYRVYAPKIGVAELNRQLAALIDTEFPDTRMILTHGSSGEYWHPAHLLLNRTVTRLADRRSLPVATMNAWQSDHPLPSFLNRDDPADLQIDARPHRDRRHSIIDSHHSQHAFFRQHGDGDPYRFADRLSREAYRIYPA